jgi:Transposase and inactivated derivatives, IS1 family
MPNCPKCASGKTVKNGTHLSRQRYRYKDCCFQFTRETPRGRPAREKATAVLLYTLVLSFNAIARIYNVATSTVMRRVRSFAETEPDQAVIVELDEMWHYLHSKKNKLWIWKAYCRDTGQLIDWECDKRDQSTLFRMMKRLCRWSVWFFCTDKWAVCAKEIPEANLVQGKQGTVPIERNNACQRHWFARFKRKTSVVSKSLRMVGLTMAFFARFHVNGQREEIASFF